MDNYEKILDLTRRLGAVRPRDVEAAGLSRQYLQRLYQQGKLERISRGLYTLPGGLASEFASLAEVAKKALSAVICLLSALQFHALTTQLSPRVWIAIPKENKQPTIDYPRLKVVWFSAEAYSFGIQEHAIDNVPVKVYSPAKTVADCFKFRNKLGLDVAIEALREARRQQVASMDDLWTAAKVCRVSRVIRPYMEALA